MALWPGPGVGPVGLSWGWVFRSGSSGVGTAKHTHATNHYVRIVAAIRTFKPKGHWAAVEIHNSVSGNRFV